MQQAMFQISDISFGFLQIPFREVFAHAAATHAQTESVWVTITTSEGVTGYGEGCPRKYVSGETLQSTSEFIDVIKDEVMLSINSLASLQQWVEDNRFLIDTNPAAWSAIELALLDVIAKKKQCSVEDILGIFNQRSTFRYTAVLGNSNLKSFARQAVHYARLGIFDYKVKLSGNLSDDRNKLDLLQSMHAVPIRIRVDANNLWYSSHEVVEYLQALKTPIFAIEEPVKREQYDLLHEIAVQANIKIILDESFQRRSQFETLKHHPGKWIINIRVSKMGGLLRSLEIIEQAKAFNIPVIIGAHVGETSLMTRVSMVAAQAAATALLAQEGGFGTYLLQYDVCDEPLMFAESGEIQLSREQAQAAGFGLAIKSENIVQSMPLV